MAVLFDSPQRDNVFQLGDDDTMIARPGEAIVNIDAITARRKVTAYVGREISHMMGGSEPALIHSGMRLVWRVPILLTTPQRGQLGVVGIVDVDARTSELLISPKLAETLQANAILCSNTI